MSQVTHSVFGSVGHAKDKEAEKVVSPMDDLKSLIELGCIEEDVAIGSKVFRLKTLPLVERIRLSSMLNEKPTRDQVVDFQINLLANAVVSVNGKLLEDLHPDVDMDPIRRKLDIISAFQNPVLNKLMKVYEEMLVRCDLQFDTEQIKK